MEAVADFWRAQVMRELCAVPSLKKSWPIWRPQIDLSGDASGDKIFALGEKLSAIFRSNISKISSASDAQSSASGGGAAWECLVTWYLNLGFAGTSVVATRRKLDLVPTAIYSALTIEIANHQTNSESDIIVFNVPDVSEVLGSERFIDLRKRVNDAVNKSLNTLDVSVVQCKTNWNDNAQIPMLWDLIYNSRDIKVTGVSVGKEGINTSSFRKFYYSFVTVPTQADDSKFQANSVSVLRVKNLSGGNYWGKPGRDGVVNCLNAFFARNYGSHFVGGVKQHLNEYYSKFPTHLERYLALAF